MSRLVPVALLCLALAASPPAVAAGAERPSRGLRMPALPRLVREHLPRAHATRPVVGELEAIAHRHGLATYRAERGGRDVLHVVLPRGTSEGRAALQEIRRGVSVRAVELRYKPPSAPGARGHVSVRAGDGPVIDLVGSQGSVRPLARLAQRLLGRGSLYQVRRRGPGEILGGTGRGATTLGLLYEAAPAEIGLLGGELAARTRTIRGFVADGGDVDACSYNCAQFVTTGLPFFASRGITGDRAHTVAARAAGSPSLAAVLVYAPPGVAGTSTSTPVIP